MKTLLIRTFTGLLFVSSVVFSLFSSIFVFYFLFLAFTIVGTFEFVRMNKQNNRSPQVVVSLLLAILVFSLFFLFKTPFFFYLLFFVLIVSNLIPIIELYRHTEDSINIIGIAYLPTLWLAIPFGILALWSYVYEAELMVLALFIIIWFFDTIAYCVGSLFGKRRLFEKISPKKTWEGFIVAFVLTLSLSFFFFYGPFFHSVGFNNLWKWMLFIVIIVVTATYGDLTESLLKRIYKIKDSGQILPGHGGVLDRFDSLFFTTPVAFVYWLIVQQIF